MLGDSLRQGARRSKRRQARTSALLERGGHNVLQPVATQARSFGTLCNQWNKRCDAKLYCLLNECLIPATLLNKSDREYKRTLRLAYLMPGLYYSPHRFPGVGLLQSDPVPPAYAINDHNVIAHVVAQRTHRMPGFIGREHDTGAVELFRRGVEGGGHEVPVCYRGQWIICIGYLRGRHSIYKGYSFTCMVLSCACGVACDIQ